MPDAQTTHPVYHNTLISKGFITLNRTRGLQGKDRIDNILAIKKSIPILSGFL